MPRPLDQFSTFGSRRIFSGQLINFTDSGSKFRNSSSLSLGVTRVTASPSFAQGARSRSTSAKNIPNFLRGTLTVTSGANSAFVGGHRATRYEPNSRRARLPCKRSTTCNRLRPIRVLPKKGCQRSWRPQLFGLHDQHDTTRRYMNEVAFYGGGTGCYV